jgi:hypothetical protein
MNWSSMARLTALQSKVRNGWRYVILFDETRQKRREARFAVWLAGGAASVILLVFLGAWWLAGRALGPLSALAMAIAAADPEHPLRLTFSRKRWR